MAASLFFSELKYNISNFKENEADRWKFLEEMNPKTGRELGYLVKSPTPITVLTSSYILFVCIVGPFIMRNRQPLKLKTFIRFYNLLMVFLAGVLFYKLHEAVESLGYMVDCKRVFSFTDQSGTKIYQMANFILLVRTSEYLDTIFFTLRKKYNQVTFLHVFHHAFVPIYAYWILRTAPTRFNVFIIVVNSLIHVLMYFYYFLATFQTNANNSDSVTQGENVSNSNGRRSTLSTSPAKKQQMGFLMQVVTKLLMFKKYMTQLQIMQFVALAIYSIWAAFQPNQCGVPTTYIISNLLLALGFLGLFLHFYMNVYKKNLSSQNRTKRE